MSAAEPIWYPTRLTLQGGASSVRWIDLSGILFSDSFFHQTVARAQERSSIVTALEAAPPGDRRYSIEPSAFIFHVSRCGSTLLCNIFRALRDTHVVAEPQPVSALLAPLSESFWPYGAHELELKRNQLLRQMVHSLGQPPLGSARRYIIKFSSYNAIHMGVLRTLWPEVPILFLVREPTEVVVSNLLRSPKWMELRHRPRQAQSVFGWEEDSADMSREEFCARAFGRLCHASMMHKGTNSMVMDYQELISGGWRRAFSFLGLGAPDDCEQFRIDMAMQIYSKNSSGKGFFAADSSVKLNLVTPEIREAADRWARPSLTSLLANTAYSNSSKGK